MEPNITPQDLKQGQPRRSMRLLVILAVLVVVLLGVIWLVHAHRKSAAISIPKSPPSAAVAITSHGFVPTELLIKPGTVVTWTNNSASPYQIASNPYPSHSDLPGLYSKVIAPGSTYSYTFTKAGSWGYADYLSPTTNGEVVVK